MYCRVGDVNVLSCRRELVVGDVDRTLSDAYPEILVHFELDSGKNSGASNNWYNLIKI